MFKKPDHIRDFLFHCLVSGHHHHEQIGSNQHPNDWHVKPRDVVLIFLAWNQVSNHVGEVRAEQHKSLIEFLHYATNFAFERRQMKFDAHVGQT